MNQVGKTPQKQQNKTARRKSSPTNVMEVKTRNTSPQNQELRAGASPQSHVNRNEMNANEQKKGNAKREIGTNQAKVVLHGDNNNNNNINNRQPERSPDVKKSDTNNVLAAGKEEESSPSGMKRRKAPPVPTANDRPEWISGNPTRAQQKQQQKREKQQRLAMMMGDGDNDGDNGPRPQALLESEEEVAKRRSAFLSKFADKKVLVGNNGENAGMLPLPSTGSSNPQTLLRSPQGGSGSGIPLQKSEQSDKYRLRPLPATAHNEQAKKKSSPQGQSNVTRHSDGNDNENVHATTAPISSSAPGSFSHTSPPTAAVGSSNTAARSLAATANSTMTEVITPTKFTLGKVTSPSDHPSDHHNAILSSSSPPRFLAPLHPQKVHPASSPSSSFTPPPPLRPRQGFTSGGDNNSTKKVGLATDDRSRSSTSFTSPPSSFSQQPNNRQQQQPQPQHYVPPPAKEALEKYRKLQETTLAKAERGKIGGGAGGLGPNITAETIAKNIQNQKRMEYGRVAASITLGIGSPEKMARIKEQNEKEARERQEALRLQRKEKEEYLEKIEMLRHKGKAKKNSHREEEEEGEEKVKKSNRSGSSSPLAPPSPTRKQSRSPAGEGGATSKPSRTTAADFLRAKNNDNNSEKRQKGNPKEKDGPNKKIDNDDGDSDTDFFWGNPSPKEAAAKVHVATTVIMENSITTAPAIDAEEEGTDQVNSENEEKMRIEKRKREGVDSAAHNVNTTTNPTPTATASTTTPNNNKNRNVQPLTDRAEEQPRESNPNAEEGGAEEEQEEQKAADATDGGCSSFSSSSKFLVEYPLDVLHLLFPDGGKGDEHHIGLHQSAAAQPSPHKTSTATTPTHNKNTNNNTNNTSRSSNKIADFTSVSGASTASYALANLIIDHQRLVVERIRRGESMPQTAEDGEEDEEVQADEKSKKATGQQGRLFLHYREDEEYERESSRKHVIQYSAALMAYQASADPSNLVVPYLAAARKRREEEKKAASKKKNTNNNNYYYHIEKKKEGERDESGARAADDVVCPNQQEERYLYPIGLDVSPRNSTTTTSTTTGYTTSTTTSMATITAAAANTNGVDEKGVSSNVALMISPEEVRAEQDREAARLHPLAIAHIPHIYHYVHRNTNDGAAANNDEVEQNEEVEESNATTSTIPSSLPLHFSPFLRIADSDSIMMRAHKLELLKRVLAEVGGVDLSAEATCNGIDDIVTSHTSSHDINSKNVDDDNHEGPKAMAALGFGISPSSVVDPKRFPTSKQYEGVSASISRRRTVGNNKISKRVGVTARPSQQQRAQAHQSEDDNGANTKNDNTTNEAKMRATNKNKGLDQSDTQTITEADLINNEEGNTKKSNGSSTQALTNIDRTVSTTTGSNSNGNGNGNGSGHNNINNKDQNGQQLFYYYASTIQAWPNIAPSSSNMTSPATPCMDKDSKNENGNDKKTDERLIQITSGDTNASNSSPQRFSFLVASLSVEPSLFSKTHFKNAIIKRVCTAVAAAAGEQYGCGPSSSSTSSSAAFTTPSGAAVDSRSERPIFRQTVHDDSNSNFMSRFSLTLPTPPSAAPAKTASGNVTTTALDNKTSLTTKTPQPSPLRASILRIYASSKSVSAAVAKLSPPATPTLSSLKKNAAAATTTTLPTGVGGGTAVPQDKPRDPKSPSSFLSSSSPRPHPSSSHTSPSTLSIPSAIITTHVCFRIDEAEEDNTNEGIKSDDKNDINNNKNNNKNNIINRLLLEDYRKNFSVYRDLLAIMSIREGNADTDLLVVNTGAGGATALSYPIDNPSVFSPCWGDTVMDERAIRPPSSAAASQGGAGPTRIVTFRRYTMKKRKEEEQPTKSPSHQQPPSSQETATFEPTHTSTNPAALPAVTESGRTEVVAVSKVEIHSSEERPHEKEEEVNSTEEGEKKTIDDDIVGGVLRVTEASGTTHTTAANAAAAEVLLERLRKDREVSEAALVELQRELADLDSSSSPR